METLTFNFWALFFLIAAAQGIFVSLLLLKTKKGKKKANRYLSALVFLLSVYLFDLFLGRSNLLYRFPDLVFFASPLWYLFAPLTLFYVKSVFDEEVKINWKYFLHFIPFIAVLLWMMPFYLLPPETKLEMWASGPPNKENWLFNYSYALVAPVQILLYSFFVIKIINTKSNIEDLVKSINEAHLSWLNFTFYLLFGYASLRIVLVSQYFITYEFITWAANLQFLVFSTIIYSLAYFAIIEPERIFPPNIIPRKLKIHIPTQEFAKKLIALVENEKLYLKSELKYTELAQRLNISARYLTEVLSSEIGCSFNDFINKYRVEEVKRKMLMPENANYSLLAIALDSGFSSKSSFNRIFKKHTGQTPTQFLNENKSEVREAKLA